MRLKIAILAGDGIGPEVTNEAVNILKAVAEFGGHDFTFVPLLSAESPSRDRLAAPHRHPRRRARMRRRPDRRGRRQQVQRPAARQAPRSRPAADSPGPRRIRQPAPLHRLPRAQRNSPLRPEVTEGRQHPLRPRAARRPLLRPAPLVEQSTPSEAINTMRYTKRRGGPRRPHRLRTRRQAPQEGHLRRQGQRPRSLAALARHRHRSRARTTPTSPSSTSSSTPWRCTS